MDFTENILNTSIISSQDKSINNIITSDISGAPTRIIKAAHPPASGACSECGLSAVGRISGAMSLETKLNILAAAAKYDAACTSSGVKRGGAPGKIGNTCAPGICHSFSSDGRCISLLKILLTNDCIFDCKYCINRSSNDIPRAVFTPEEIAELTINFYRRNYIVGLFLSSAVIKNPTYTMQKIHDSIKILRDKYNFNGYIHVKAIPGADPSVIEQTGFIADRMSVNIELPSEESLKRLAPNKSKKSIFQPMNYISGRIEESKHELAVYKKASAFVPAGQSTQMIIGATPDTDNKIIHLSEGLYRKYKLKRVFYSAFVRTTDDSNLPVLAGGPPLLREHRLYQADWLLRFYNFKADELLNEENPNFNTLLDPKCDWAVRHMGIFPVEINRADYNTLLRVPGIGVTSAKRIITARRAATLDFSALKRLGVVLKRAQFFITCQGKTMNKFKFDDKFVLTNLIKQRGMLPKELCSPEEIGVTQLSLFDASESIFPDLGSDKHAVKSRVLLPDEEDSRMSLSGDM